MNPFKFLGEVRVELAKVIWPTRAETIRYTLTVIVFSLFVAFILGAFDYALLRIFQAILSR
ncbi:MAG TPA: preprotein translocase subunit SecE [Candidatus Limnocylindria bacterium]|nr:preprotein translocase subunit SecE [Candidatus Limnocylindria bacterium]